MTDEDINSKLPDFTVKYLYVVEHYVPRPLSKGGRWTVIAESDAECYDLITADDEGGTYKKYYPELMLKINLAGSSTFVLMKEEDITWCCGDGVVYSTKSRIIDKFIT